MNKCLSVKNLEIFTATYSSEYDAENRIINVKTSRDKIYWENDASYAYYKHGPLARDVLGQTQVQGLDYAYTLQGWLKGVNSTTVSDGTYDMGNDGKTGSVNSLVARDAYGFSLNYFTGDYLQINTTTTAFGVVNSNLPDPPDNVHAGGNLFNGNIRAMAVNIPKLGNAQLYGYRYDQLNRIVAMNTYSAVSTSGNTLIDPSSASQDYNERISYDANGNILGYLRNGATAVHGLAMDSLTYKYDYYTAAGERKTYTPGGAVPSDADRLTNQLNYVKDAAGGTYTEDIKDEDVDNYTYDEIGNLTSDTKENIDLIEWTVYGKINHIHKTDGTDINYTYDASGNRITKTVRSETEAFDIVSKTTYYVRDASGNVMSVYRSGTGSPRGDDLTQTELHLYGSSRLGIYNVNNNVQCPADPDEITTFIRGDKFFELSSQTGNILATVSDKKIGHTTDGTTIDYYDADVITANDMYSGGMQVPGRQYQQGTSYYRFSINGQEKENELNENTTTALFWEYDSRIGRRWNIDQIEKVNESPYLCFSGNPIMYADPLGLNSGDPKPKVVTLSTIVLKSKITKQQKARRDAVRQVMKEEHITWGEAWGDINVNGKPNKAMPMNPIVNLTHDNSMEQDIRRISTGMTINILKGTAYVEGSAAILLTGGELWEPALELVTDKSIRLYINVNMALNSLRRRALTALLDLAIAKYGKDAIYRKELWALSSEIKNYKEIFTSKTIITIVKQLDKILKSHHFF